ncbi:ribokinase-like isoform X1 [Octopus vulgaris]|uniref:Ribokinase n=1 Tax=Octopus vulgaris TaxID=6645 RepID=A0AA36BAB9_OCTVU|nr:ribokinase-like isoform X1 [Octopus vulgaris]
MDVVVVGSFMADFFCYCPEFPKPGETVHGSKFQQGFGGKGANQCVMASLLGAKTAMVGRVGTDQYGTNYLDLFHKYSINTDHVKVTEQSNTGIASVTVNDKGQNNIVIVSGANEKLTGEDVEASMDVIGTSKVLLTQLETPTTTTLKALQMAKRQKVTTVLNPAPARPQLDPDFYKLADYFCPNETEAELLVNRPIKSVDDAKAAVPLFLERGCSNVIITLGALGSVYGSKGSPEVIHVPSSVVTAVDSTGAGDAFIGSFAYYLSHHPHLDLREMIRRSSKIASVSVQKPGAQTSFPSREALSADLFA